ncbi:MAG: inositol monophosphatase [Ignavibacteria bacterium]|nr:inositol monophosphatase [Ignavibacteria bacterium]
MKIKETLIKATEEAGKILKENFGGEFKIESKDRESNLVTEVDKKSEEVIMKIIKSEFSDHYILTEESGDLSTDSDYKWIIDPIDGTINYAHSIPLCCVSIGVEHKGELIFGAVYNPMGNEFFYAGKGEGSFLNNKKIKVSQNNNFRKSLLVTGFPYNTSDNPRNPVGVFAEVVKQDIPVRRLGSAALDLCWVACGRFEGFWEFNLNAWDTAAGALIVTEAGGKLSSFEGGEYSVYDNEILASNGLIHNDLLEVIKKGKTSNF